MHTQYAGPGPLCAGTPQTRDSCCGTLSARLVSSGGRRYGFCRVCSVRPTVPCAMQALGMHGTQMLNTSGLSFLTK